MWTRSLRVFSNSIIPSVSFSLWFHSMLQWCFNATIVLKQFSDWTKIVALAQTGTWSYNIIMLLIILFYHQEESTTSHCGGAIDLDCWINLEQSKVMRKDFIFIVPLNQCPFSCDSDFCGMFWKYSTNTQYAQTVLSRRDYLMLC